MEEDIRNKLDYYAELYNNLVTNKAKKDEYSNENIISLIKAPGREEWYEYKTTYKEIYKKIKDWFDAKDKLKDYKFEWIFSKTKKDLHTCEQIFCMSYLI
ncbi:hypothetical protein HC766_03745 [Candidatus Gracilibacteria bacterium]|nr:hypothetical protein [Candidatus Gracilibacteria bacterium]